MLDLPSLPSLAQILARSPKGEDFSAALLGTPLLALGLQAPAKKLNFRGPHAPRSPMTFVIPTGSASRLLPSI